MSAPRSIVDLGCGAGNVTRLIGGRFPDASIVGVDGSAAMLAKARETTAGDPRFSFIEADLAAWMPQAPVDLVYSNAALHWLPDHERLFARVMAMVASGGTLAVQMPDNFGAPSHTTIAQIASGPRWCLRLGPLLRGAGVAPTLDYFRWLAPSSKVLDIWTTEYLQVLPADATGMHPVAAWTKGSRLTPLLAALDEDEQREFLAQYEAKLTDAYPPLADGRVLFPFRRLFIVANR